MNDTSYLTASKNLIQQIFITNIPFDQSHILSCYFTDTAQALRTGVDKVVNCDGGIPCPDQLHAGVTAYVSGAARYKNIHFASSFTIFCIASHFFSMSATSLNCVRARSKFCPSRWVAK